MKRIILTLSCIISILWFMPLFVHAESSYPTYQEFNNYFNSIYDEEITQDLYNNITTMWNVHPDYVLYTCTRDYIFSSNALCFYIGSSSRGITVSGNTVNLIGGSYCFRYKNSPYQYSSVSNSYTAYIGGDYNGLYFGTKQEFMDTWNAVDFENLYYDPTIPTPEFIVTMERPTPWENVSTDTNFFDITWNEYSGYYVQIGYKYSYPNGMKVGLVDGQTTFTPLTYANSEYIDLWALEDMHDALYINSLVNGNSFELESEMIQDSDSWQTSVPIWANNFNNSGYTAARNKWNTKMRFCWPLYGLKLEIFERLYYVADGLCYVGAWKHWNNSYPSDYQEEIPNNYQVGSSMPGYSNTSNNTEYQEQVNTETSIGTQTGVNTNPLVIVNSLTPNYPDYPTVATYNHDNLLLQFFTTAKQLPSSFSGFTTFLSASLTWIPSYIWDIIAFGLLASITVMVIKIL